MNKKLNLFVILFLLALVFLDIQPIYAFDRTITNQSTSPWLILGKKSIIFDNPQDHRLNGPRTVCRKNSELDSWNVNYCILPPGEKTYAYYPDKCSGELQFSTKLANNKTRDISVSYRGGKEGISPPDFLSMSSSDESRINDNHGDITIFPHAAN